MIRDALGISFGLMLLCPAWFKENIGGVISSAV